MKTRNLFLSLFAFAALCACNKEAQPENPILGEDACITVSIVAPNDATKAPTTSFEDGDTENAVHNALFVFYSEEGTYMYQDTYSFTFNNGISQTTPPNVESISDVKIILQGETVAPRQMVVILNYDNAIENAVKNKNISALNNVLTNNYIVSLGDPATDYYVMTNSTYMSDDKVVFAALIDEETHIYKTGDTPKEAVQVYVERVSAKVRSNTPGGTEKTLALLNGSTLTYKPFITGYALTSTAPSSYVIKQIDNYNWSNWLDAEWNDPNNKRSYWANSYTSGPYNKIAYEYIADTEPKYCHENTDQDDLTKLMIAVQIKGHTGDDNFQPINIVRYGAGFYLTSELLTAIATELNGFTWSSTTLAKTDQAFTVEQLQLVADGGHLSKVALVDDITSVSDQTAVDAVLAKYEDLLSWVDGKAYFYSDIAHFGEDDGVNDKGIVRNHIYDINITKIAGLGTPVIDPTLPIEPSIPDEIEYNLQAQINILRWKVVRQNVSFGE